MLDRTKRSVYGRAPSHVVYDQKQKLIRGEGENHLQITLPARAYAACLVELHCQPVFLGEGSAGGVDVVNIMPITRVIVEGRHQLLSFGRS